MGHGKFDGESHEQLYNMISGAKPSLFSDAEEALNKAHTDIAAIGEEFKAHVAHVQWEGEGADAFRAWGDEMAKQTLVMAEYTKGVGHWIGHAGKGLSAAQSAMPPVADLCFVDPKMDAKRRLSADKKLDEAIQALEKADSYVTVAQEGLDGLKEPNFPILPSTVLGDGGYERPLDGTQPGTVASGGGGGFTNPTSVHHTIAVSGGTDSPTRSHHGGAGGIHQLAETGRHGVESSGTVIDSTVTAPYPDTAKHVVPDHTGPTNNTGPLVPGPAPAMPSGPTSPRGTAKLTAGRNSGLPEKSVTTPRSAAVPRAGKSDGIFGGTSVERPTQSTGPRLPRGTVIGEERTPMSRAPMGAGGYGAGSGRTGTPSSNVPGRRLASEMGGSAGAPRPSREGRSEFTQGGSGLVRGAQAPGAMPHSRAQAPGKPGRRGGSRPDYLTEDEETWASGRRGTVPPVID
ncbi:hypothetical protein [Streptomyces varsoviensis]|uniref:PPE family domain-containing protein n=1 Tax=Streptomyces varsoviensis TaxID=67373 RepID=A0ABR5J5A5_9ACTN|nr:hypothetical protein [Streptomyces varsoviensis]KOG88316.1 hypothetical protein ADK38_20450 [Streptomyces varsoviensis]